MDKFNFDTLTSLINQQIQLKDGSDQVVDLTVDKVSLPKTPTQDYEAFSVDLSGSSAIHCPTGNYLFSHEDFGEVQLFMSPYGKDKYQIVIARKI